MIERPGKVAIHLDALTRVSDPMTLRDRVRHRAMPAEAEARAFELRVEDGRDHQRRRALRHAVAHGGDRECAPATIGLRHPRAQQRLRLVKMLAQVALERAEVLLHAQLELVEADAVHARSTVVGLDAMPRRQQRVGACPVSTTALPSPASAFAAST